MTRPQPTNPRACHTVREGAMCRAGLWDDEHRLVDGQWVHPDWYDDADEGDYCHRTDDACTGRSCWVCEGDTPTTKESA
jgi:hypothetical protein